MNEDLKFLVVDDQHIIRESLCKKIKFIFGDVVVAESASCGDCHRMMDIFLPDIVFMDISMPEVNGITCTKQVLADYPGQKIIAFSMNDNDEMLNKMLKAGVKGYLLKTDSVDDMKMAVEEVLNGNTFISKNISKR